MLIEIFSDFSCPWCFLGYRRLKRALTQRSHLTIQIVWQPFQLNPELPFDGVERGGYLRSKFGDLTRLASIERTLEELGEKEQIRFDFASIPRTPNTMRAHRLMRFAAGSGHEAALAEALFSAYFEQGKDICAIETLVACAVSAGFAADAARTFLTGETETDAVRSIDELGHESGISGVPYFIFDRRYAMAGAQEPVSFLPLFDALASGTETLETSAS